LQCTKPTAKAFVSGTSRESLTQTPERRKCRIQKQDRKTCGQKTELEKQRQQPKRQPLTRYAKSPVRLCSARKPNFKKDKKKG
jgi:hypothetical protein